jgi:thioredoxin-dependent peroxiredoxin
MPLERKDAAIHDGKPVTTIGDHVRVGHMPARFELDRARSKEDKPKRVAIEDLGPKFILLTVPSLDTPVCDEEVKRFGELSGEVPDYAIIVASMDLPFAQERWLRANSFPVSEQVSVDRVMAGSDHRTGALGIAYGVLMKEPRLLQRAVFVSRDGYIKHVEYVLDSAKQVDFDAAIAAAKK